MSTSLAELTHDPGLWGARWPAALLGALEGLRCQAVAALHPAPRGPRLVARRMRAALALALMAGYVTAFETLLRTQGAALFVVAAVPVVGAGALVGLRPALLAALALLPLHTLLFQLAGQAGWDAALRHGGSLAHAVIVLLGIVVGALQELIVRARALVRECEQAREAVLRERRALDEQARLAGVLLAARTVQHELNNRLSLTVGYADLLMSSPDLPADLYQHAEEARRGAAESAEILNQLQRLTRIEEQSWGPDVAPTLDIERGTRSA